MRIHNLYAGPDGETHFRDVEGECTDARPWGNLSKCLPTTGMMFVEALRIGIRRLAGST
jgi:hypothetical protein